MTLPVTETVLPVKLAVFIIVVAIRLLAVTLPVVDTGLEPKAAKLATTLALPYELTIPVSADPLPTKKLAVTLPVTETVLPVKLAVFTMVVNTPLLAVTLPVTDTIVPV